MIDFEGFAEGQAFVAEKPTQWPYRSFSTVARSQVGSVVGARGAARFRKADKADGNPQASLELGACERGVLKIEFRARWSRTHKARPSPIWRRCSPCGCSTRMASSRSS